jgi:CheY-like chemotaxis protein
MKRKHTILFVDDEENILHSLRRLFHREGYDIMIASSGPEGLDILRDHTISLIVSDQRMPDMIGAKFLTKARAISPQTIRMMLTGYSDLETATQAINEGGIARYITKPWNDDEFKMIVHDAINRLDLEIQNEELTDELQQKNAELEAFNAHLEEAVRQRTQDLRYKVKELEGKDRIAQHMLSLNSVADTLELVLQVIADIIEMEQAIIYLIREGQPKPVAAIGAFGPKAIAAPAELENLKQTSIHQKAFARVEESKIPVNIQNPEGKPVPPFAVVPILRGEDFLGFIEIAKPESKDPLTSTEVQVVASFALQAAVAISDAQAHRNIGSWKGELEDILKDIS